MRRMLRVEVYWRGSGGLLEVSSFAFIVEFVEFVVRLSGLVRLGLLR